MDKKLEEIFNEDFDEQDEHDEHDEQDESDEFDDYDESGINEILKNLDGKDSIGIKQHLFENLNITDLEESSHRKPKSVELFYSKDIEKYPLLEPEKLYDLFDQYKKLGKSPKGLKIREKIINSNLKLVCLIAKSFYDGLKSEYKSLSVDLADFIQAGNIGLISAVDRYDKTKYKKFYSYARYYIKGSIYDYLNSNFNFFGKGEPFKPSKPRGSSRIMRLLISNFCQKNGKEPSDEDLKMLTEEYNESFKSQKVFPIYAKFINTFFSKTGEMPTEEELIDYVIQYNNDIDAVKISNELKEKIIQDIKRQVSDFMKDNSWKSISRGYGQSYWEDFINDFMNKYKNDLPKDFNGFLKRLIFKYRCDINKLVEYIEQYNLKIEKKKQGMHAMKSAQSFVYYEIKKNKNHAIPDDQIDKKINSYNSKCSKKFSDDYWCYYKYFLLDGVVHLDDSVDKIDDELLHEDVFDTISSLTELTFGESDDEYNDVSNIVEDKNETLGDRLIDLDSNNPEDQQIHESLKKELKKAISTLTQREQDVINLYYGLNGNVPMTFDEIGKKLGLTRERVRQIEEKAVRRLKHTNRSKELKKFLA